MSEVKNILSLTFEFTVRELTTTDLEGNPLTEEVYTISCGDSVCWNLIADKSGDAEERDFIRLQVEHVLGHLKGRLEHRAKTLGDESYFIAGKKMSRTRAKDKGQEFFRQRVRSDEARAKGLLSIKRGRPRRLNKAEQAKLPERYEALHDKFIEIKSRHDAERKRVESERNRGLDYEEWQKEWLSIAKSLYPRERREYLELIADLDDYTSSPSQIAYLALAKETGHTPQYMKKLVPVARKAKETD